MKWVRRGGIALGVIVAVPLLVLAAIQVPAVQGWLARQAASFTAGTAYAVQIDGLSGSLPFAPRIRHLTLADRDGVWLELEDARLDVAWQALFRGRVHVEDLSAERIAVARLPVSDAPPPAEPFSLPDPTALPRSIPPVTVDRIHAGRIELGQPILGEALALDLNGQLASSTDGGRVDGRIDLRRIDQPTAELSLATVVDLAARRLNVDLKGSETGGLMARLTGMPTAGDLRLALTGDGPLDGWQGRITGGVGGIGDLNGTLSLAASDSFAAGLDATFAPAEPFAGTDYGRLVGDAGKLGLSARIAGDGSLALQRLNLALDAAKLSGHASIPAGSGPLDGAIDLHLADLGKLAGLAGRPLGGALDGTLTLGGDRERPQLGVRLIGDDLSADQFKLRALQAQLGLVAASPLGAEFTGADLDLALRLSDPAVDGAELPPGDVTLSTKGAFAKPASLQLTELALAGLGAELNGHIDLDLDAMTGQGAFQGDMAKLAALSPFLPPDLKGLDGTARLDVTIAEAGADAIKANGTLAVSQLTGLPPQFAPIVGDQVGLDLEASLAKQRGVTLQRLDLRAAGVEATGKGSVDLTDGPLALDLNARIPDLAVLAELAGMPITGSTDLDLAASGSMAAPQAQLALRTTALGGLPEDLTALLGTTPTLSARAARAADGTLTVQDLALETATAHVTGNAAYDPNGAVDARLQAVAENLGFLGRWLGGTPAGQARLDLVASGTAAAPQASLDLAATGLDGFAPNLAGLLGQQVTLSAKGRLDDARVAHVDSLDLEAGGASASGTASYGLDDRSIAAKLQAAVDDLSRASALAGTDLAGRMQLAADASGSLDQLAANATLTGTGIRAAGSDLGRVEATTRVQGSLDAPTGTLQLSTTPAGQTLSLSTGFAKDGQVVQLTDLRLRGPQTTLDGAMRVDLAGPGAEGSLRGGIRDLGALRPWTGMDLGGQLSLDAALARPGGRQDARINATVDGFAMAGGMALDKAQLTANATDLLGRQQIDAKLTAAAFSQGSNRVETATLSAKGPLAQLAVALDAKGEAFRPFVLALRSTVARQGDTTTVDLTQLSGSFADRKLALQGPARLVLAPSRTSLAGLDLAYDQARLQGSTELAGNTAQGKLTLKDLPLSLLQAFGGPELGGTLQAGLDLDGSLTAPRLRIDVETHDLTAPGIPGNAPVKIDVDTRIGGGRATGEAKMSGLGRPDSHLTFGVPMRLALQPFAFAMPEDDPIEGRLDGNINLATLGRLAALDGQQLGGVLHAAMSVGGTLAAPRPDGSLTIENGAFLDVVHGIAIRQIALDARASGGKLVVQRLTATDGGRGRLDGTGQVDFLTANFPYRADLKFDQFQPIRQDIVMAQLGGTISASGTTEAARVVGRLRVDRAEIMIPSAGEGGGGSIPVVELTNDVEPGAGNGPPARPFRADLDIVVDMPERVFLRGRGLESEWGGSVAVRGTSQAPVVTGRIEIRRGYLNFLDRRFAIRRGIINLDGAVPPNPTVDLEATFQARTLLGVLKVTDRATDPTLTLTSEPVRPQDEILAEILFGRDVSTITPMQGLRLAAAVNELRGGGSSVGITDRIRRGLGVDTLEVGGSNPQDTSVRAGKYLSDNVFMQVERGTLQGSGKVSVQVEVLPNVSVSTDVTENAESGVGVQWRHDY